MSASDRRLTGIDIGMGHDEPVRYQRPELPTLDEIGRYYALAEDARFYSNGGPCWQRLSTRLAAYAGPGAYCVPVANCTLGLMVALRDVCGEPSGRRRLIAVPSFTFTATACAIRWAGFEPLFVDIEEASWQLHPDALDEALWGYPGEVAGVLGCSTFGTAPPTAIRRAWREVAARHGVPLLLDSAAGFGATDEQGRRLGALGDVEVFSFHATKPFAIGEGGAIFTPDAEQAHRLTQLVNFGIDPTSKASVMTGMNAKMSELAAATGLAMLDRFDDALASRRATAASLQGVFEVHPLTYQQGNAGSTWQVFQALMPDARTRARALAAAEELNVEVRTCFDPPLHRHPAFAGAPVSGSLEVTERLGARALSMPLANTLGPRQVVRLAELLQTAFEE
jgi:dTDP-4-amino-4,6-dideoxygalactose transaminase